MDNFTVNRLKKIAQTAAIGNKIQQRNIKTVILEAKITSTLIKITLSRLTTAYTLIRARGNKFTSSQNIQRPQIL